MPVATEIAKPDLDKIKRLEAKPAEVQRRLNELATRLVIAERGSPKWFDVLYLLLLEYGQNLKYLNPVFAKLPGAVIISSGLVLAIKYWANRIGVKTHDLKDPETL